MEPKSTISRLCVRYGRCFGQLGACILFLLTLASCSDGSRHNSAVISVEDQRMVLLEKGTPLKSYPVSTSKFGLGSQRGSNCTPLGELEVARKIGRGAPSGAVFKSRKRTGEILPPNSPGRDPIVTRILWLRGKQAHNSNALQLSIPSNLNVFFMICINGLSSLCKICVSLFGLQRYCNSGIEGKFFGRR